MSFDLAVWWEPGPVTAQQAYATYLLLCDAPDADHATPWPLRNDAVVAFYDELTAMYPTRAELGDDPATPWMDDPWPTDSFLRQVGSVRNHVILHIAWSREDTMRRLVRDLAFKHGLVVLEPAATPFVDQVNNLQPTPERPVMQMCDGSLLDAPSPDEIAAALGTLVLDNTYAILSVADEEYIQTALSSGGARTSLPVGFDVEFRAGSADEHYVDSTMDPDVVVRAFQGFAAGDDDWRAELDWTRVVFE